MRMSLGQVETVCTEGLHGREALWSVMRNHTECQEEMATSHKTPLAGVGGSRVDVTRL